MSSSGQQFGRKWSLLLTNRAVTPENPQTASNPQNGLVLSDSSLTQGGEQLRMKFDITANDVETPNIARIRVYNLSEQAENLAISEYGNVVLSAGYESNFAQIFKGTIKQYRRGRERNVDNFLDIYAADSDINYNFGVVNAAITAGSTPQQRLSVLANALGVQIDPSADEFITGGILPRGKVMFGLARSYMRDLANSAQARWSIQNGVLTVIPLDNYLASEPIKINSATGMIGVPDATDQGIQIETLLNPLFQVGRSVQLNNADITTTFVKNQLFPGIRNLNLPASVSAANDGIYRVIVVEHTGDTRDINWYTRLTCLLIDKSAKVANPPLPQVAPFG